MKQNPLSGHPLSAQDSCVEECFVKLVCRPNCVCSATQHNPHILWNTASYWRILEDLSLGSIQNQLK